METVIGLSCLDEIMNKKQKDEYEKKWSEIATLAELAYYLYDPE